MLAAGLGHPEQEPGAFGVAHQQPRLIDGDQPPPSPGGGVGDPPPGRVQGQQGPDGLQLLGQVPQAEHDQVPGGAGRGRRGEQGGVGAVGVGDQPVGERDRGRGAVGAQRGGQVGQQRGGPRPGPPVGADPGVVVGGHDRLVQGGLLRGCGLGAGQDRDDGVGEQGAAGQRVRPRPGRVGQVERVQVHPGGAEVDVGAAERRAQPRVLIFGVDDPAFGPVRTAAGRSPACPGRTCPRRRWPG